MLLRETTRTAEAVGEPFGIAESTPSPFEREAASRRHLVPVATGESLALPVCWAIVPRRVSIKPRERIGKRGELSLWSFRSLQAEAFRLRTLSGLLTPVQNAATNIGCVRWERLECSCATVHHDCTAKPARPGRSMANFSTGSTARRATRAKKERHSQGLNRESGANERLHRFDADSSQRIANLLHL